MQEKVTLLRTDGAKELRPEKFLFENEADTQDTPPYSPESNARVERANRTIFECARTVLQDLYIRTKYAEYKTLWPGAIQCAVYISNRTLSKRTHVSLRSKTPFEIITGEKLEVTSEYLAQRSK